jgi:hypothetical protein
MSPPNETVSNTGLIGENRDACSDLNKTVHIRGWKITQAHLWIQATPRVPS